MHELKVNYWPATPHLRELKFYCNNNIELSVFCDLEEIKQIKNMLELTIKSIEKGKENE
jgi:hypothetical protein